MQTRSGTLWSIPYPQELNDIPMIVARQMDGRDFADMIVDNFDEMLAQSKAQPLVMGIALHPYIVGQPYRLRHLRDICPQVNRARTRDRTCTRTSIRKPPPTPAEDHGCSIRSLDAVRAWTTPKEAVLVGRVLGRLHAASAWARPRSGCMWTTRCG